MIQTVQEALEAWDPDEAERMVSVERDGWFIVPAGLSPWLYHTTLIDRVPMDLERS